MTKYERDISLHGSGFAQIKMPGGYRMHVWHPDFPVKEGHLDCEYHDHRFEFTSRVLVGVIKNVNYDVIDNVHSGGAYPRGDVRRLCDHGLLSRCLSCCIHGYADHDKRPVCCH